jgi:hypothetical protein
VQFRIRAVGGGEAEVVREPFRRIQVRLVEFQPGQVLDLDHRVSCPRRAVLAHRALLAVQVLVRGFRCCHRPAPQSY